VVAVSLDFFMAMLADVEAALCVDTVRRFVTGGSNGGMMIHRLAAEMPSYWAAVLPIYGLPLQGDGGYAGVPAALANVSILQFHDRWDATIPVAGGKSGQGWFYTGLETVLRTWLALGAPAVEAAAAAGEGTGAGAATAAMPAAAVPVPVPVPTKWDGGAQSLACWEYSPATAALPLGAGRRRIMKCLFDGYHGSWLPATNGEELTWWFMRQFI